MGGLGGNDREYKAKENDFLVRATAQKDNSVHDNDDFGLV